ncbi:MAG: DUF3467 domain-containing protein [Anaerolineales bacterium]|nr:DUF3467 domain-containing protein [Anaerolineales bacterium]
MNPNEENNKPKPVPIKLMMPPDLIPTYSNLVRIAHSPAEFIYDFSSILPGDLQGKVVARVVMNPVSAKLLMRAMTENIAKYEAAFGEINLPKKPSLADHLFKDLNPPHTSEEEND